MITSINGIDTMNMDISEVVNLINDNIKDMRENGDSNARKRKRDGSLSQEQQMDDKIETMEVNMNETVLNLENKVLGLEAKLSPASGSGTQGPAYLPARAASGKGLISMHRQPIKAPKK